LLEGLKFKNLNFRQSINKGLPAEEEIRVSEFFQSEVIPVFSRLQKINSQTQEIIEEYFSQVKDCCGYLYLFRN
jgi:hypothetical protein